MKGKHLLGKRGGRHVFGTVRVGERGQIVIPKEARALFGISPGDTLLVLGDEEHGLFISKPDVMSTVADQLFRKMEVKKHEKPE